MTKEIVNEVKYEVGGFKAKAAPCKDGDRWEWYCSCGIHGGGFLDSKSATDDMVEHVLRHEAPDER